MLFLKAEHDKKKKLKESSRFELHKLFEFPSLSYFLGLFFFKVSYLSKLNELLPFTYDVVF